MSFRLRLTLVAAAAVAVTIAVASVVIYFVVRSQLRAPVDSALRERAATISQLHLPIRLFETGKPGQFFADIPGPQFGEAAGIVQLAKNTGQVARGAHVTLPITDDVRAVGAGTFALGPFTLGNGSKRARAAHRGSASQAYCRPTA